MQYLQHAVSVTGTKIVNADLRRSFKLLDCLYMASCQIYYMDVIAHTGTVRRIIIVAEHAKLLKLAHSYLSDVRKQIVRNALRILADESGLVRTNRIEITKQYDIPLRVRYVQIGQDVLPSIPFVCPYGFVILPFGHSSVIGTKAGSPYTVAEELKISFFTP